VERPAYGTWPASVQGNCTSGLNPPGVFLGMSKTELLGLPDKNIDCDDYSDEDGPATELCRTSAPIEKLLSPNDTFAGRSVSIQYFIHNDVVAKITLAFSQAADYEHFKSTLTIKYGAPKIEALQAQNKMGATFPDELSTWERDGDVIMLQMRGAMNINYSLFQFLSREYIQATREWKALQEESAVSDT
jgi:hypothetical protein